MPTERNLENLISEITLRATAKVCHGLEPWRIEAIAKPLADAMMDVVVEQGNIESLEYPVHVSNYIVFELWNQILDEVVKEIPVVSCIEVRSTEAFTRTDRQTFLSGEWRKHLPNRTKGHT